MHIISLLIRRSPKYFVFSNWCAGRGLAAKTLSRKNQRRNKLFIISSEMRTSHFPAVIYPRRSICSCVLRIRRSHLAEKEGESVNRKAGIWILWRVAGLRSAFVKENCGNSYNWLLYCLGFSCSLTGFLLVYYQVASYPILDMHKLNCLLNNAFST